MSYFSKPKAANIIGAQPINNKLLMHLALRAMKIEYSFGVEEESDISPHTEGRIEVIGCMSGEIGLAWIFVDIQSIDSS